MLSRSSGVTDAAERSRLRAVKLKHLQRVLVAAAGIGPRPRRRRLPTSYREPDGFERSTVWLGAARSVSRAANASRITRARNSAKGYTRMEGAKHASTIR
jgi:YD repeat-containing protein